jgi:hypothetical protein
VLLKRLQGFVRCSSRLSRPNASFLRSHARKAAKTRRNTFKLRNSAAPAGFGVEFFAVQRKYQLVALRRRCPYGRFLPTT